jgi:hypothetical protein
MLIIALFEIRKLLTVVLLVLATLTSYSYHAPYSISIEESILLKDTVLSKSINRKDGKNKWQKKQWRKANTARFAFYMSPRSKKVIRMMNLARLYGDDFARIYIEPIELKSAYEKSLYKTLVNMDARKALRPSFGLHMAALSHSVISGFTGRIGHQGFKKRVTLFSPLSLSNSSSENCEYGSDNAVDITLNLLIDRGVPGLGHRRSILSKQFYRTGASSFFHSRYGTNSVTDFSGAGFRDLIFRVKPDRQYIGLELSTSQISDLPFFNAGFTYLLNHQKTAVAKITAQYKFELFQNGLHGAELEMAQGIMSGITGNFMFGVNVQTYFPVDQFTLYLQPKLTWFLPLNLFRDGALYQIGYFEHPALYQLSYGYNFGVCNATIPTIYKHQVTISRYINLYGKDNTRRKRKRRK